MKIHLLFRLLPLLFIAACGADSEPKTSGTPQRKKLSERMDENNGYKQDAEGNWKPRTDKRSSFESQGESPNFKKAYKKSEYKTGDYAKKSWWGNKEHNRKAYDGNTDGSRFDQSSRFADKTAGEASNSTELSKGYDTDTYATSAARETKRDGIRKVADAETENRQKVFDEPEIIDWREQRRMSIDQSKSILGR